MKLKKFLSGVGALFLCSALLLPVPVQAADQRESTTTITTAVVRHSATPACWRAGGSLRRSGERSEPYKPPLSNKGGTKNKRQ